MLTGFKISLISYAHFKNHYCTYFMVLDISLKICLFDIFYKAILDLIFHVVYFVINLYSYFITYYNFFGFILLLFQVPDRHDTFFMLFSFSYIFKKLCNSSITLIFGKYKIKIQRKYHLTPIRMALIRNQTATVVGELWRNWKPQSLVNEEWQCLIQLNTIQQKELLLHEIVMHLITLSERHQVKIIIVV